MNQQIRNCGLLASFTPLPRSVASLRKMAARNGWRSSFVLAAVLLLPILRGTSAEPAAYAGLKPDEFLRNWLVLKSIHITRTNQVELDENAQKTAFAKDWLGTGGELSIQPRPGKKEGDQEWRLLSSKTDLVDLKTGEKDADYAIAYAWAEIESPVKTKVLLGVGSDDAIKIWLNGKLLHQHWGTRLTRIDEDVVPAELEPGKNQLLLKIQNVKGDWSFVCRSMGEGTKGEKLIRAVMAGADIEAVKEWLGKGMEINSRGPAGLTAAMAARLRGETEMLEFLASRGAETNATIPPREELVDVLFRMFFKNTGAGAAVLASQNGKVLFQKGYGLADLEHHVKVIPQTKFRIGSITKQFTAAAILKLQQDGKLNLNDKLSKYLPDFPRGDEVTLHHLLTHTSGIHSYTEKPGFMDTVTSPVKSEELINSFKNDPYDFAPGKQWRYDNSGYFLLGYIIEKASEESYGEFMQRNLFEPLGMSDTGVHRAGAALEHEALGYQFQETGFSRALNWDMSRAGGAGALYSTVEDLNRWNEDVFNGKVLDQTSLKAAFTPVKTEENKEDDSGNGYGYGWAINHLRGALEISHGGGLQGFSSFLMRLPEQRFTVAVLANALPGTPGADPAQLAHLVAEIYLGEKLGPRSAGVVNAAVSTNAFEAVVGRYDYGNAVLTVTREGSHLFAQLSAQPRFEIFPKSETDFFWKVVDAQVTFVKDPSGHVIKAVHHQGGSTINAPRMEDIVSTKVDPADYGALTGKYDYGQGKAFLTISREGTHLFAQLTGQPRWEIFPRSSTEFYWKVVNAQVTFVKDAAGKVTKAIHHQAGQTFEAPKLE
jgi:CubicO group peptidase (beta-lactamase class C family)